MKKIFKILRKIIKFLLKIVLWLILGIIVIFAIILVIINNRTLKFYEDEDYNIKFTMNKDFKVEEGTEFTLKLNEGIILYKDIYSNGKVNTIKFSDIKWRNLSSNVTVTTDGIIETERFIDINLPKISFIKKLYKQGYIKKFTDYIIYCFDFKFTSYYDNGQISGKGQRINGLGDGYNIYYYENGNIEEEIIFINGIKNNTIYTGYYKNGNIKYIGQQDGLDWIVTGYFNNGNINFINNYNGYSISYYENKNIKDESFFKNGNINGITTGYYIDGKILGICNYNENGDISCIYYDENENILGSGEKINGQYNGINVGIHDNGKIEFIGNFNGKGTGYYENGNIGFIGNYINGVLTGESIRFSTGGNILEIGNNENWYRINTYYDENGNILGSGCDEIISSCSDSLHMEYSQKDGKILEKGKYNGIQKDGYRVEYFENGKIYSEGNYENGKRVGTRNRYLGDGSIGVSKNYDE